MNRNLSSIAVLGMALFVAATAHLRAEDKVPPQLEGVGIDEKLGAPIDLNLTFIAENGYPVPLKNYFQSGRPVILNLVYYTCPMLCNLLLNGQTESLRQLAWTPGKEFDVVTVSIDPRDNFEVARKKRASYLESYERETTGWHFLVDNEGNAAKLASEVGFRYRWDEKLQQFAHAAAIIVLTPEGKVSRYLYGIKFKERDLKLALTEAAKERFGLSVERVLLFCYHYDPKSQSYVPFAENIMRLGGVVTMLVLGFVVLGLFRKERSRTRRRQSLDGSLVSQK